MADETRKEAKRLRDERDTKAATLRTEQTKRNRSQLGAYLLICLLGIYSFWQLDKTNQKTERNSEEAAYNLCASVNENRQVLRGLIARTQPATPPANADPALLAVLAESRKKSEAFQKEAADKLADEKCPPPPIKK